MKARNVVLVGGGGHALSLMEFAKDQIAGYLAPAPNGTLTSEWLGDDANMVNLLDKGLTFHIALVYSGFPSMKAREKIIKQYIEKEAVFTSLIAPSSIVTSNSSIGCGTAIMAGSIINRAKIGSHVIVNSGAIVEHDCTIGDNTFIGPGAVIGGFTEIGRNCFIGLGARIANGIKIVDDITIGMGTVVTKHLMKPGIYAGNPIRYYKLKSNL